MGENVEKKRLNKHVKGLLIALAVILVLGIIALGLSFGLLNNLKFASYTKGKLSRLADSYDAQNVRFIAHRGLSVEEYQNTEAAFRLAAEDSGVWGIETDVWATSDGNFVCMHDRNALKGINNVRDVTLAEATTTPLRHNENYYAPSVETYLNICKEGGKVAVVEIKDEHMTNDDIDKLLTIVDEVGVEVRFISFHFDKLQYIRSKDADVKLQWLVVEALVKSKKLEKAINLGIDLSCMYQTLAKSVVKMFHDAGREVGVWTCNNVRDALCLATELDADYITTDVRMRDEIAAYIEKL